MIDYNMVNNLAHRDTDINEYLLSIYNVPKQMKAKTIVEIGAGQSTFALLATANEIDADFYSIDLFDTAYLRAFPDGRDLLLGYENFHGIYGDCMEIAKTWDKEIDFLLYDTSHLYEDTKKQIRTWFPFVRKGGIIFMHDTAHKSGDGMGCRQALNEFLESEYGKEYRVIHLLDTKHLGGSFLIKI